jgi:hypothetical protein
VNTRRMRFCLRWLRHALGRYVVNELCSRLGSRLKVNCNGYEVNGLNSRGVPDC